MGPLRPPRPAAPQVASIRAEATYLTEAQAERLRQNPIEGRGAARRIVIIARTLGAPRGAQRQYLVARIPLDADGLGRRISSIPEAQRAAFIRSWRMRNRDAMIDAYLERRQARFTFEAIPPSAVSVTGAATPRRTERAAPRRAEAPATPRRVETPEAGPSAGPTLRITRRRLPTLPSQVRGGSGTRASPYQVHLTGGRATRGIGAQEIVAPTTLDIEGVGNVYVRVNVTANMINSQRLNTTSGELRTVFSACIRRAAAERGRRLDSSASRTALSQTTRFLRQMAERASGQSAQLREYYRTH